MCPQHYVVGPELTLLAGVPYFMYAVVCGGAGHAALE